MSLYLHKFGALVLPMGIAPATDSLVNVVPHAKALRGTGARAITGTPDARSLVSRGALIKGPISTPGLVTIQTTLDSLVSALITNAPANLYFGRDDRYLRNVQVESLPQDTGVTLGRIRDIEIHWLAPDPFYYAVASTTDTWTVSASAQTRVLPVSNGTAVVQPTFNITVGGVGAQTIAYTITHNTTGQAFTLAGAVTGGNVIVVNTLAQTVTIGGVDKISLFDGLWMQLQPGANTIREDYTGATITQIVTSWQDRYL
jgi:phage-related protein